MALVDKFLKLAAANRASDVHFSAGEPVRMRVDGDLLAIDNQVYDPENLQRLLFEILTDHEREKLLTMKNLDKSYSLGEVGFFRVNIFWTRRGIGAVLRTIPQKIPTIEQLKLPPAALTLAQAPKGLVLVTGPTGSGKSTTLAAMINWINTNCPYHILTAEDPVEFVHESKMSLINQREIGSSCSSFADALKYALREDPDVILVGEMRDLETIGLALTAAETGHLVFGTLHTRGAGASVDRIIDSFPANQQAMIRTMLSESLVGVISQSLLKKADGTGRVAAFEIMLVNHAISNLIREGKTFQMTSIIQTGRAAGMILMDQHLIELVSKGIVTAEEAEGYMEDPAAIAHLMGTRSAAPAPKIGALPPQIHGAAPVAAARPPLQPQPANRLPAAAAGQAPPPLKGPAVAPSPVTPSSGPTVMATPKVAPAPIPKLELEPELESPGEMFEEDNPSLTDLSEVTLPMVRRSTAQPIPLDTPNTNTEALEFDGAISDDASSPESVSEDSVVQQNNFETAEMQMAPAEDSYVEKPAPNAQSPFKTAPVPIRPTAAPTGAGPANAVPRLPPQVPRSTTLPPPPVPKKKVG